MHHFSPGVDSSCSRSIENIDCSVVVTVQDKAAERTGMDPVRKRFIYSFTTTTAVEACASGRNFLYPAPAFSALYA
jgi:hypothetical protein